MAASLASRNRKRKIRKENQKPYLQCWCCGTVLPGIMENGVLEIPHHHPDSGDVIAADSEFSCLGNALPCSKVLAIGL